MNYLNEREVRFEIFFNVFYNGLFYWWEEGGFDVLLKGYGINFNDVLLFRSGCND